MRILIPVEDIGDALLASLRDLRLKSSTLLFSSNPINDLHLANAVLVRPHSRLLSVLTDFEIPHGLSTILSDSTGISHLQCFMQNHPELSIFSLRDIPLSQLNQITAAGELSDLLLRLSIRPVHSVLRQSSNISIPVSSRERASNLGNTINSTRLGLWGFGRIGQYIFNQWKNICSSIHYYDPYVRSANEYYTYGVSTLEELLDKSDLILLAVTDDVTSNVSLINQTNISFFKDKKLVNISRSYMVDSFSVLKSLNANELLSYYTDFPLIFPDHLSDTDLSAIDLLIQYGKLVVLPHIGGATHQSWLASLTALLSHLDERYD